MYQDKKLSWASELAMTIYVIVAFATIALLVGPPGEVIKHE